MTDLRDLYRGQEPLVDAAVGRLLPVVRQRYRRRRTVQRIGYAGAALVVAAMIGGIAILVSEHRASPLQPATQRPPAAYRIVSSLGMQIAVPDGWQNSSGCLAGASPAVARPGVGYDDLMCFTGAPTRKEFAVYESPITSPEQVVGGSLGPESSRTVRIDGVAATRVQASMSEGRFAGWVTIASRDLGLIVRTNSQATLTTILDSVHLVTVDNMGCPTIPSAGRPAPASMTEFVDPDPVAVSVCYYGSGTDRRLKVSDRATGPDATALATALNAAPVFSAPSDCPAAALADTVLLIRSRDGTVQIINAATTGCGDDLWLDNGHTRRQAQPAVLQQILAALNAS